ncbi:MAG: Gp138 family membrane-puncturing spike protein [Myxococcota bacterium]
MTTPYSLAQLLDLVMRRRLGDVHTAIPARVERYDAETQTIDAFPLLKQRVETEDGSFEDWELPVVPHVPVCWPGGGGFRLTFPLAEGDTVLLVFAEGSLDRWQKLGGLQGTDGRRHHLSDAVAVPGLHHDGAAWKGAAIDAVTLGKDEGTQVVVKDGVVLLGAGDAAEPLVLGTTYRQAEDAWLEALTTALTKVSTELGAAAASLTAAAAANAVPIVGGALAAAPFSAVVTQLGLIAADLASVVGAVQSFKGGASSYLSGVSKTK